MRSDVIRIYKAVHTWTGIVAGMALFIAFYAGALTVFKEPLARWVSPPATSSLTPLDQVPQLIAQTLRDHPEAAKDFTIHLQDTEQVPERMTWQVRAPQAEDHDESSARHYGATLDAAGLPQVRQTQASQLATFIDVLHRVVGLPVDSDANRWIMGVIATLYALALVSGVIVLLPTLVKDFFALRLGKNLKRMWLDAHNVVGLVSLPFHIVMALTAVIFAFHDDIYRVQDKLLYDGKWAASLQRPKAVPGMPMAHNPSTLLPPQELLARVQSIAPHFEPSALQYQQITSARALVRVWGKDATAIAPRARGGFAILDPYSGKIINTDMMPGRQNTPSLFISSFFALHMASFGGTWVQWLYFLLGLAGAWLFYSGNLLWIESRRKAARQADEAPIQRLDTRMMASATVGVCLGCVCGISLTIVGGKWLYGMVDNLNAWHVVLYYTAFFASLAWAFMHGGAKAAVHLLWFACLLTLAIPATTLLGWLNPSLSLWAHTSAAPLGVDATAFVMALTFGWMAHATSRRIHHGARDSVWSAA